MTSASTLLAEKLIGKGMKLGPELDGITETTTTAELQVIYDRYVNKFKETQARISQFPLEVGHALSFSGEGLRKCGKHQKRAPSARPELYLRNDKVYSLKLNHRYAGGPDSWAQVWRCDILGEDIPESAQVVVKLYQESYFPEAHVEHFLTKDEFFGKDIEPADNFATREAAAYDRLAELQGTTVPYCYGFHKFMLPCGENVEGVILENIEGRPCLDFIKEVVDNHSDNAERIKLLKPFYLRVDDYCQLFIKRYAVVHHDLAHTNMIVTSRSQGEDFSMVVVDFGRALTPETIPPLEPFSKFVNFPLNEFADSIEHDIDSNLHMALMEFWV